MSKFAGLREITILTGAINNEQSSQLRGYCDMLFFPFNRKVECKFDCNMSDRYVRYISEGSDINYTNDKLEEIVNWTRIIVGNVNVEFIIGNRKEIFMPYVGARTDRRDVNGERGESTQGLEVRPKPAPTFNRASSQNASDVYERLRMRANRRRIQGH